MLSLGPMGPPLVTPFPHSSSLPGPSLLPSPSSLSSSHGATLATASWDKTVQLWDSGTGERVGSLQGHQHEVYSLAFSPDGRTVASGSWDNTVRLWDAPTGKLLRTLKGHTAVVRALTFSPDATRLASGSKDSSIRIWEASTGKHVRTLEGHEGEVESLAFSPDGTVLGSGAWDQTVRLWSSKTGEQLRSMQGHTDSVKSVAFSPNGRTLASASEDKTVRLWDCIKGEHDGTLFGHALGVSSVAFAPNGKLMATASRDKSVRLWNPESCERVRTLEGHGHWVSAVAFSPDGTLLASASWDKTVKLWDTVSWENARTIQAHEAVIAALAFAPKEVDPTPEGASLPPKHKESKRGFFGRFGGTSSKTANPQTQISPSSVLAHTDPLTGGSSDDEGSGDQAAKSAAPKHRPVRTKPSSSPWGGSYSPSTNHSIKPSPPRSLTGIVLGCRKTDRRKVLSDNAIPLISQLGGVEGEKELAHDSSKEHSEKSESSVTSSSLDTDTFPVSGRLGVKEGSRSMQELDTFHSGRFTVKESSRTPLEAEPLHSGRAVLFMTHDLEQATGGWNKDNMVGEGGFGSVYKGVINGGLKVAIKRMREADWDKSGLSNELQALGSLRHPHIVALLGFCPDRDHPCLVYEYLSGGDLRDALNPVGGVAALSAVERIRIASEVAAALQHLHQKGFQHRDLKPGNILLDEHGKVKLGDWGLAFRSDSTVQVAGTNGTPGFVAPEVFMEGKISPASDIYSFGVILLQLLTGFLRVRELHGLTEKHSKSSLQDLEPDHFMSALDPKAGAWPPEATVEVKQVVAMALQCVSRNRIKRPSLPEICLCLDRCFLKLDAFVGRKWH